MLRIYAAIVYFHLSTLPSHPLHNYTTHSNGI